MADLGKLPSFYEKIENVWTDTKGREYGKLESERFEDHSHPANHSVWWIRLVKPTMDYPREREEIELTKENEIVFMKVIRYQRRVGKKRITAVTLSK